KLRHHCPWDTAHQLLHDRCHLVGGQRMPKQFPPVLVDVISPLHSKTLNERYRLIASTTSFCSDTASPPDLERRPAIASRQGGKFSYTPPPSALAGLVLARGGE